MPPKGSRTAPLSNEADAVRKREKCGAEACAQEKVALQFEARASFVATVGEAHEASERHKPDVAAPSQQRVRSKRIAEASALALALEEEIAQSEIVLPEEREKKALQDKAM